MSDDIVLDYPVESEFVQALKEAQRSLHVCRVQTLLTEASKGNPNIVIELSNDDWIKDRDVELPQLCCWVSTTQPSMLLLILKMYDGKHNVEVFLEFEFQT